MKLLLLFVCHSEMLKGYLLLVALLAVQEKCFLFQEFKVKMLLNTTTGLFFTQFGKLQFCSQPWRNLSLHPMKCLLHCSVIVITAYPPEL